MTDDPHDPVPFLLPTNRQDELEDSDIGRDPRYPSGAWIGFFIIASMVLWAIVLIILIACSRTAT